MSFKNRQMTVLNKSNKIEENGSRRMGLAGARERPSEIVTERIIRLCKALVWTAMLRRWRPEKSSSQKQQQWKPL